MTDVAVDLGTANTLIHIRGEGVVLDEPSVIAVERSTGRVIAVGLEASRMIGRTPENVLAVKPMRGGVIADVTMVDLMLRCFLQRVLPRRWYRPRPRVVIVVPSGITEMERRAVKSGVIAAGAGAAFLLSEPIASAIGSDLPVTTSRASMVVNLGGGTTEIGMIALSSLVTNTSVRVAGQDLDQVIAASVRRTHSLLIGDATAEAVKIQIGSACEQAEERGMEVRGQDLVSGIPRTIEVGAQEVRASIRESIQVIVQAVHQTFQQTPPELAADVVDHGLVMTGGGARLRGLEALLETEVQVPVRCGTDPERIVIRGAGMVLDDWNGYRDALIH